MKLKLRTTSPKTHTPFALHNIPHRRYNLVLAIAYIVCIIELLDQPIPRLGKSGAKENKMTHAIPTITEIKNAAKVAGFEINKERMTLNSQPAYKISKGCDWKILTKDQMVMEYRLGDLFDFTK